MSRYRKLLKKLKKAHIKMLRYYALNKRIKAYEMEVKAIHLELELKDEK